MTTVMEFKIVQPDTHGHNANVSRPTEMAKHKPLYVDLRRGGIGPLLTLFNFYLAW